MENFNLDDYDLKNYKRGDIVEGKVISIQNDNTLVISIPGSAIDGIIHLDHYTNDKSIESFKDIIKVGDTVKATVTKKTEDEILLSRLNQIDDEVLDKLNQIKDANETLTVNVVEEIEGKGYRCEYNSIRLFMPRSQATKNVTVKSKIDVKIIDSDPKKHKLDFVETFDKYNLDFKALTLIKYFINLGDQLDSSIGLHCLKHYQESGMLKKYPKDVVEQAVSWMRVYKYDPDVFFGDMDFTNPEAVAFFKKKGFKF